MHNDATAEATLNAKHLATRGSAEARLIHAMRHADCDFEEVNGTTRRYVRECLIPQMEVQHIEVIDSDEAARLRAIEKRAQRVVEGLHEWSAEIGDAAAYILTGVIVSDDAMKTNRKPTCQVCDKPLSGAEIATCDDCKKDWESSVAAIELGEILWDE